MALCHDWLVARRGGELVLEAIAEAIQPMADLDVVYTMFDNGSSIGPAIDPLRRKASFLSAWPARRWLLPLYPLAVWDLSRKLRARHRRKPYDLVISTHSAAIKAIKPPKGVPHVCYCHAPARYIWTHAEGYAGGLRGLGLALIRPLYKVWDRRTARRVETFFANSTHTHREIGRAYKRQSDICFPPVRTRFYTYNAEMLRDDDWLAVGALVPYKRFDLAIEAANKRKHPLKIIGTGPELERLKALAGPTVTFEKAETDVQLRDAYRRAKLVIFPQLEDFGIVAVEAQACGTPVVAYAKGGAKDTVIDGSTGAHFESQSVDSLLSAIDRCPKHSALACRENAERFSEERFREQIARVVREFIRRA
ncbi:MAG: glycosyltransferase [Phycisphaerales bacterium]|nr:glycosyltransferase [Phycisphaerales bacterium]MCB9835330.1 glycosyltransferase [Phycisphaera sp.]